VALGDCGSTLLGVVAGESRPRALRGTSRVEKNGLPRVWSRGPKEVTGGHISVGPRLGADEPTIEFIHSV